MHGLPISGSAAAGSAGSISTALSRRAELVLVTAVLGVAMIVRFHGLTAGGIWLDEGYTLLESERSFRDILALSRYDANPPLYVLLLRAWREVFGASELAAKSLSAIAGVAGVIGVWLATRVRFGALAGIVAALLVALSRFHIHYSQEIRGYALVFAAVAAADFLFVRWDAQGRRGDLIGWCVAGWVAVHAHQFAWWVLAVHALFARRRRATWIGLGAVVLASAWTLVGFAIHLTTYKTQSWIPPADGAALAQLLWVLGGCGAVAVLVWCLAALGLAVHVAERPLLPAVLGRSAALPGWRTAAVPGLELALPFAVWLVSLIAFPMLVDRYLLISLLPLACLAGAGVTSLRLPAARLLLIAALIVLSIPPLLEQRQQEAQSGARQDLYDLVRARYRDGDVVLYASKWTFTPAIALHPPTMEEYLLPELEGSEYSTILRYYTARRVRRDPPARGEYERLWLVLRPEDAPEEIARSAWFRALAPRLEWAHPSGLLLRFQLPLS